MSETTMHARSPVLEPSRDPPTLTKTEWKTDGRHYYQLRLDSSGDGKADMYVDAADWEKFLSDFVASTPRKAGNEHGLAEATKAVV